MAYTAVNFVYGEVLTATKMNILAANDASFNDGTGLGAGVVGTNALAANAITTAKIVNSAVTSDKIDFTTHSTTEITVGTWIDGKTIYRKTISLGSLPNASSRSYALDVSIDTLVKMYGSGKYTNGTKFPIPLVSIYEDAVIQAVVVNNSTLTINTSSTDRSGATGYITIEYTKN